MSRAAYERLREALEGTALDGQIDRLNADLHLTPDSPEWAIAVLALIGTEPVASEAAAAAAQIKATADALPDALRAAGVEIVRGLADDIAAQCVQAITSAVEGEVGAILRAQHEQSSNATDALSKQTESATRAISSAATKSIGELEVSARRGVEAIYAARVGLPAMLPALMVVVAIIGGLVFGAWTLSAKQSFSHGYAAAVRQMHR